MKIKKLENIKIKMRKKNIDILGLTETGAKDISQYRSEELTIVSTGGEDSKGSAVVLNETWSKRIVSIIPMNGRVIIVKLKAEETKVAIVQAYMPRSSANDKDIEEIYLK